MRNAIGEPSARILLIPGRPERPLRGSSSITESARGGPVQRQPHHRDEAVLAPLQDHVAPVGPRH